MNPIQLRNVLFKAFIINYVAVFLVWLLSLANFYHWVLALFYPDIQEATMTMYLLYLLGAWKILGVVLFLIPAAALHWQFACKCCKKV